MLPESGSSIPANSFSNVDFPVPFAPIIPTRLSASILKLKSEKRVVAPMRFVTEFRLRALAIRRKSSKRRVRTLENSLQGIFQLLPPSNQSRNVGNRSFTDSWNYTGFKSKCTSSTSWKSPDVFVNTIRINFTTRAQLSYLWAY